jgi:hypothetical protein
MSDVRDSGCCGATFEREHISLVALLTVAFPLVLIFTPLQPLLWLAGRSNSPRWVVIFRTLFAANIRVIRDTHLLPKLRCDLGARLFPLSPALAGFSFKAFNLVLLSLMWLGTGSAVAVILGVMA